MLRDVSSELFLCFTSIVNDNVNIIKSSSSVRALIDIRDLEKI